MPTVRCGLEVLVHDQQALLQGRRVALLAHQASIDSRYAHAASLLGDLRRVRLVRLLAPEHGLWGAAQDHARVGATRDPATGLPVFSLYGSRPAPTRAMLRGADVLVVDLQDIGARYYTFVWTMALSMQACARVGVSVVVLDRPNPLGGAVVEGNVPDPVFASFVGLYPLPARPGLTLGEIAMWLASEHGVRPALSVIGMRGWRRAGLWEDTGGRRLAPGRFRWKRPPYEFERRRLPIDILLGTDQIRRTLERGRPLREIEHIWAADLARWRRRCRRVLAYR